MGARGLVRDARRDPSSNDDVAGLEALDYWTHLCDCARRKTDVRLFVSNEYLSFRFGCIIEPTGFIMNKHTYIQCACAGIFMGGVGGAIDSV